MKKTMTVMLAAALAAVGARAEFNFADPHLRVGCNYWASHAGLMMWRSWDAKQVEKDVAALKSHGIDVMRVFPLWPDFQPLTARYAHAGEFREWAQNDGPFKNLAGVEPEMMARFRELCDIAQRHDMKLVVGLITGWMSGRVFAPPALERRNLITDPEARMWQVRFVRHFVREMKDHAAIAGWDLGNECNCLGRAEVAEAWAWLYEMGSAIRLEDATRPVVSGMHSLHANAGSAWNLRHQGELMDVLTTHPYPLWTPDMHREPFNTLRNGLHASAESLMYAGVSGKPCFAEEAGDMGRYVCSEARAAGNVRNALWTAWANGLGAYMWWCSFDQGSLRYPPYTWTAVECDLGLMRTNYEAKPALKEIKKFAEFLKGYEHAKLPPRRVDAVCLVNESESSLAPSMGAFMLSRQAGFDVRFAGAEGELPESAFYILPSGQGMNVYSGDAWRRVLAKARAGATLLVSRGNDMALPDLREATGNEVDYSVRDGRTVEFEMAGAKGRKITARCGKTFRIISRESMVAGRAADGEPVVTVKEYGKGKVVFVNYAIESDSFLKGGAYHGDGLNPHWLVYRFAAETAGVARKVEKTGGSPNLGLTEHALGGGRTLVVAVNYDDCAREFPVKVRGKVAKVAMGGVNGGLIRLGANETALFEVEGE